MAAHVAKVTGTRGEVTPLVHARVDMELYRAALKTLHNWYVLKFGGWTRRTGTRHRGSTKFSNKDTRFVDFIFSSTQAYAIELGDAYTRFWTSGAQILSGMSPYEIVAPYAEANLRSIQWAQSNDIMFFAHASTSIPTKKLTRSAHDSWAWADVDFVDGPYLPINDADNAVSFSAVPYPGDAITITHANTTNINDGAGFQTTDVGRHYRFSVAGTWAWGKITARTSTTVVTVTVVDSGFTKKVVSTSWARRTGFTTTEVTAGVSIPIQLSAGTSNATAADVGKVALISLTTASAATGDWYVKINSVEGTTGVNASTVTALNVTFLAQSNSGTDRTKSWRLGAFSQTTGYPGAIGWFQGRLFFGRTDANPNAAWYGKNGFPETFSPSDFDGTVVDDHGGMVSLLGRADEVLWLSEAPRAQIGTAGAIRSLGGTDSNDAFGPRNVSQRQEITGGVANVAPIRIGPSTVHAGRFGKSLNDLYYDFNANSLIAPDISTLAEHMFDDGIKELWFQQYPNSMLWVLMNDGTLVSTTMDRYEKVVGFARQTLEGGNIISGCTIPGSVQDDVYMIVRRTINGSTVQYVETLEPRFLRQDVEDAWFVDCGGQYSGAPTNTVSGISWLFNTVVDVLADGVVYQSLTVSGAGVLTLPGGATASKITLGIPIANEWAPLAPPIDAPDGASKGRRMRVTEVIADVFESSNLWITSDRGAEDQVLIRPTSTPMGDPDPLVTDQRKLRVDGSWASRGLFTGRIIGPLPGTIRALNIGLDYEP